MENSTQTHVTPACDSEFTWTVGICANNDGDENVFLHDCANHATCINLPETFECECNAGWADNGQICGGIDECDAGTATCNPVNSICSNNYGYYACECKTGFSGDGTMAQLAIT